MYRRIVLGPASYCVRIPGNREPPSDSDRKAGRREARTSATKTEVRAEAEVLARLSDRPLDKRRRVHRSVPCDTKLGVPFGVPLFGFVSAIESGSYLSGCPWRDALQPNELCSAWQPQYLWPN